MQDNINPDTAETKRSWHTPEMRKNSITRQTQFEAGPIIDGYTGEFSTSLPNERE